MAVTLRSARGLPPGGGVNAVGGSEAVATLDLSFPGGVHPVELRSRARRLPPTTTRCEWNERFLVSPPAGSGAAGPAPTRGYLSEVVVTAAVTDLHAAAGNGSELASTALALDELLMPAGGGGDGDGGRIGDGEGDEDEAVLAAGAVFHGTLKLPLTDNNHNHNNNDGGVIIDDEATTAEIELEVTVEVISAAELDSIGTSSTAAAAGTARDDAMATMASSASSLAGTTPAAAAVAIGFTPEGPWLPLTSLEVGPLNNKLNSQNSVDP